MRIKFIKPFYEIDMMGETGIEKLKRIEKVARTCYKSEDKITDDSYIKMITGLVKRKHLAMIEFADITVKFTASRAFSHELVRHRIASFAQESQRYVGYGDCIEFIIPDWVTLIYDGFEVELDNVILPDLACADRTWVDSIIGSAMNYKHLLDFGWKPEQARDVLPNASKTEINIKTNLREWSETIKVLRAHDTASPQMRELMRPMFGDFKGLVPIIFD